MLNYKDKKILFFSPKFFGYEKELYTILSNKKAPYGALYSKKPNRIPYIFFIIYLFFYMSIGLY